MTLALSIWRATLLPILLFLPSGVQGTTLPAEGQPDIFAESDNWTVLRNRTTADCRIGTVYENGTTILIYFNAANRRADFTFANDAWKSLEVGQKKDLYLRFAPGRRFAAGPGTVVSSRVGEGVAINLGFADGVTLLADFSAEHAFNLVADGVSLGTYPLTGSQRAIDLLVRCAAETAAEGAWGDPFAR